MTRETKETLRVGLSDVKLWIGVSYFVLAWVVAGLFFDYTKAQHALQRAQVEAASREASDRTAHKIKVTQCLASIPEFRQINQFEQSVHDLAVVVERNAQDSLASVSKRNPQYRSRLGNVKRIEKELPLLIGVRFKIPTVKQCKELP